ncbi:MAG: hypothetical protein C0481_07010 [Phenylobacterium sp.]|uniref:DUF2059 domain-containing protein n=1 Tax=Phenylobacterium sp. TaxID=1871053 RepID=UPI0025EF8671|nr:DUF2059 domain-containing protein [Phenylobacterium sp.]MBA4011600.1 hypothetical protein [Phenylobacterium sp.]
MRVRIGTSLAAGLAAMLLAGAASAQTAPTARQLDLAQRYVKAMKLETTVTSVVNQLGPTVMGGSLDSLPPEKREAVMGVVREVSRKMMAKMSTQMAPMLAEVFTEKELEDVVAFYEGPSGQALIEKSPQLSAKMAPLMNDLMPEMQTEMLAGMCEVLDCDQKVPRSTAS